MGPAAIPMPGWYMNADRNLDSLTQWVKGNQC